MTHFKPFSSGLTALAFLPLAFLTLVVLSATADAQALPQSSETWNGYSSHSFQIEEGVSCKIIAPKESADGMPWIWRARFFGHEPQLDLALLKAGFHVAYCDVSNLFGSQAAMRRWDKFYKHVTETFGFSKSVSLEGMSRGGLIIFRWAAQNPDKVNCIYGDAPVCDFKSWPGGKGSGDGSKNAWQQCLQAYGFENEQQALDYASNPIDVAGILAKANVPVLIVYGSADVVVPPEENCLPFEKHYRANGSLIKLIGKEGIGHHPHSLKDPSPILEFVLEYTDSH